MLVYLDTNIVVYLVEQPPEWGALTARRLRELADIAICVPATETYKIQELHLPVYHALCAEVEEALFG